jgi:ankyrin repeat protein
MFHGSDLPFVLRPIQTAGNGYEAMVKLLVEKGADLESKDSDGRTPLSWAAENGYEAVVKLLVEKGADLESRDRVGRTSLSWAAGNGYETVVRQLVEKGVSLLLLLDFALSSEVIRSINGWSCH